MTLYFALRAELSGQYSPTHSTKKLYIRIDFATKIKLCYFLQSKRSIIGRGWKQGVPNIFEIQCERRRAVCTVTAIAQDNLFLVCALGSSGRIELWSRRDAFQVDNHRILSEDIIMNIFIDFIERIFEPLAGFSSRR